MFSALLTFAADEFKFFLENLTVALLRHENIHFFLIRKSISHLG